MKPKKGSFISKLAFMFILTLVAVVPTVGHTATFTVNSTTDAVVANAVVNGVCETAAGNGVCTLRAAIQLANVPGAGATIINLPAAILPYKLTLVGAPNENAAASGDLDITSLSPVTIIGAGVLTTIIDGNNTDRVFDILGAASNLSISGVTIQNGNSAGLTGGAINVGGGGRVLNLDSVIITGNKTNAGVGGTAVAIGGGGATVRMNNVAIDKNIPVPPGGGNIIDVGRPPTSLTVTNSTISSNGDNGISNQGTTTLTNVTISLNTAVNAAGIDNKAGGTVTLQNCTINGNIATAVGGIGGIRNAGTVTLKNTIITNNTTNNCSGVVTPFGNNLSNVAGCGLTAAEINNAPGLLALANNTGPVQTHALLAGSPAIDKGAAVGCPGTDARGIVRPVAGLPPAAPACDIGAFEFRPQQITVTLASPFDFGTVTSATTADHTITLTNAGDGDLILSTVALANPLAAPFSIVADTCSGLTLKLIPVPAANSCTITTRFAPTAEGTFPDTFNIPSNDPATPAVSFALTGAGTLALVPGILVTDSIAPTNDNIIPFGGVTVGGSADATITVTNTGTANLIMGTVASSVDPLAAPFSILNDTCSLKTVAPTATCTLTVHFAPTAAGAASDTFNIPSTGLPTVTVSVNGSGGTLATTPGAGGAPPGTSPGNNPPSNPVLVSPTDAQLGVPTTMTFIWKKSLDPDGDVVKYHFMYGTDPNLVGATTVDVAAAKTTGLLFAGLGSMGGGIILFGFVSGSGMKRSRKLLLAIPLILMGALFTACGGGGGGGTSTTTPPGTVAADEATTTVTGLAANTTYYWKVVAEDVHGALAASNTFSFKTQ
jgi:CSLREA domain-containing protein